MPEGQGFDTLYIISGTIIDTEYKRQLSLILGCDKLKMRVAMPRHCQSDIILELLELSQDVVNEIRQQLIYYSASVYKTEAAEQVKQIIAKLRLVIDLIPDEFIKEPFLDFEAEVANGQQNYIPGECMFTSRITRLLQNLEKHSHALKEKYLAEQRLQPQNNDLLTRKLRKHRGVILSICQHGSRRWNFFQSCS